MRAGPPRLAAALLLAIACPAPAADTGPSSIRIRLRPVAVDASGEVLLRTWREANPTGRPGPSRVDLGWLLVSARGLWREAPHRVVEPDAEGSEASRAAYRQAEAEFLAPLDLSAPPASLQALLSGRALGRLAEVDGHEGAGEVTWTAHRACVRRRCTPGYVAHRTVGRLEGRGAQGGPLVSTFYRAGVAVFRSTVDAARRQQGVHFEPPGSATFDDPVEGRVELGFELAEVDAVAIVEVPPTGPD